MGPIVDHVVSSSWQCNLSLLHLGGIVGGIALSIFLLSLLDCLYVFLVLVC